MEMTVVLTKLEERTYFYPSKIAIENNLHNGNKLRTFFELSSWISKVERRIMTSPWNL